MEFNRSKFMKAQWAGRSQAARSKIGKRIAKKRNGNGFTPWNKGLKGTFKHTAAARKRISDANKGRKHTERAKAIISVSKLGSRNPMKRPDVRAKCSTSLKHSWKRRGKKARHNEGKRLWKAQVKKHGMKKLCSDMSRRMRGSKNPSKRPEVRKKISLANKRRWRNKVFNRRMRRVLTAAWARDHHWRQNCVRRPSVRRKQSLAMKGRGPVGRPRGPRKVWYYGKQGHIRMRSKDEVRYAKELDAKNIPWLYECTTFILGKRSWTPDFYLPTQRKFVEIKGWLLPHIARKINLVTRRFSATHIELRRVA